MNEGLLSVKNASGRQVSLLNTNDEPQTIIRVPTSPTSEEWPESQQSKRKYHCVEPGCNKSFTTSGHLARHNRIHTGEKNFPCLFPGCQSRFSRQDNMMQHYRTHMSPKSRRSQKRGGIDESRPRPRLHAHHRIKSDPVQIEPPLTIDQHLSNYHQSLRSSPLSRFNFPVPLSSIARNPSTIKKNNNNNTIETSSPSPTLSHSSSTSLPSIHHIMDETIHSSRPTSPDNNNEPSPSHSINTNNTTTNNNNNLFYQHRPLTFSKPQNSGFPYTLLHPAQQQQQQQEEEEQVENNLVSTNNNNNNTKDKDKDKDDPMDEDESPSSGGLHQLAHIVSTFG